MKLFKRLMTAGAAGGGAGDGDAGRMQRRTGCPEHSAAQ